MTKEEIHKELRMEEAQTNYLSPMWERIKFLLSLLKTEKDELAKKNDRVKELEEELAYIKRKYDIIG